MHVNARCRTVTLAILVMASSFPALGQDFDKEEIHTSSLRDNLYLLTGIGGNVVVFTGTDGALIVDDEYRELNTKLMVAIEKITDRPFGS